MNMIKKIMIVLFLISFIYSSYAVDKKTKQQYVDWLDTKCEIGLKISQANDNGSGVLVCWTKDWSSLPHNEKKAIIWAVLADWTTYTGVNRCNV